MSDLNIPSLFKRPRFAGEYLIGENTESYRIFEARMQNRRVDWYPGALFDHYAETALTAYKLSAEYLSAEAFQQTTLVDIQIRHFAANLAAKLHRLAPFESREMIAHHAVSTVLKMSQLNDKTCMQMLLDAGVVLHQPHMAETQCLLRKAYLNLGEVPQQLIKVLAGSSECSNYTDLMVSMLVEHPTLVAQLEQLDQRILLQLKRTVDDNPALDSNHQWLHDWFNAVSETCESKTNYEVLMHEIVPLPGLLDTFTVRVMSVGFMESEEATGCGIKTTSRLIEADQASLAAEMMGCGIFQGRMEMHNGELTPVFRSEKPVHCDATQRQTLSAVFLKKINGHAPDTSDIQMFCDLFSLEFDFSPHPELVNHA